MSHWANKTVLITGAGSGIGRGVLEHALREGAQVSALIRSENAELESRKDPRLLVMRGDVAQRREVKHWLEQSIKRFAQIDVVINNAGAMYYMSITEPHYGQMEQMIQTNCIGFINLMQEVLPYLTTQKKGHWINISSDAGKQPFPGLAVYSGTKAFVEFTARAMRQELIGHNIKITNIQPGNVDTSLHGKSTEKPAIDSFATENKGQYLAVDDIVCAIDYAVGTPYAVAVNEIMVQPLTEST